MMLSPVIDVDRQQLRELLSCRLCRQSRRDLRTAEELQLPALLGVAAELQRRETNDVGGGRAPRFHLQCREPAH